jgi:AcrR family transcriptional regulator
MADGAGDSPQVQKIVRGAITALGRHGSHSLSMSDVALAAKVSRATLYRYFPTKTAVLAAVSEYISATFVRGAERIAREIDDPVKRLRAIMSLQIDLATQEFITRSNEVEPGLVSKFLREHYAVHLEVMVCVLDPLFDRIEAASGTEIDRDMLAAMVLRMHLSVVVVPPDARWRDSPEVIADMLGALLQRAVRSNGASRPRSGVRTGRKSRLQISEEHHGSRN